MRVILIAAALISAGLAAWILLRGDSGSRRAQLAAPARGGMPRAFSPLQLQRLAHSLGHVVYWAGPRPGVTYEVTRGSDQSIYVRYLPAGVAVGDRRSDFVTIGTYPMLAPYAAVRKDASQPTLFTAKVGRDGLAVTRTAHPSSVYLAYPRGDVLVEVYAPAAQARRLVLSGRIVPVPGAKGAH